MNRIRNKEDNSKSVPYLTPADVAKRLLVSPITVNQWAKKGWIKSFRTGGGHHRFLPEDLEAFCRERGLEIADSDNELCLLIVDADLKSCTKLERLINKLSLSVTVHFANSVFNAGRLVERYKPNIVMIDLSLPGLNIVDLCQSLREANKHTGLRIIMMHDMHLDSQDISAEDRALTIGAELLIPKPVRLSKLKKFLEFDD